MNKIKQFIVALKPYKGILYFLVLLFFFHFFWKIAIDGDRDGDYMYFFGKDITPAWFHTACLWLTSAAAWFIHLLPGMQDLIREPTLLYFPDGGGVSIVWGCTGIKQMAIFAGIILLYWGPFLKKLWYIPLGCIILTGYNVIRIGLITVFTRGYPERFDSLHDGIFRYIYYTIVFLLWVYWEDVIVKKYRNEKCKRENSSLESIDAG
ncbi:MAG: exosortase/archaeosortase family protein [Dysgonamonadaceae bacterium]|jgi:exosortase/archaeosortase family protein|nr:exosortase/archaeosortase family protein [Dysgonamonadaceae bacterium]